MTPPPNFEKLLQASMTGLQIKTQAHMNGWGIHKAGHWDIDTTLGLLVFTLDNGTIADCAVQIIGTFSTMTNTWLWSWANPSVPEAMQADALRMKQFGEQHNFRKLTLPKWPASEQDAWMMTALAVKTCETQGAYRCPADGVNMFVSIHSVKLHKAND